MRIASGCLLVVLASIHLAGQSNGEIKSEIKLDNAKARAILETYAPHQAGTLREYPLGRVLISLDEGKMRRTTSAGKVETFDFKVGDARWDPAGAYQLENVSDHPVRVVGLEPKSKGPYSQASTKLDPAITVPDHYRVIFDNEQVRALRITFAPHTKGALHEHLLDRAVVQVKVSGDGTRSKPGDVGMAGYNIHIDSNDTDQAQERIAVELK